MAVTTIKLKEYLNKASITEKGVIEFILNNTYETSRLSIYELAEKTYSSPSTIIRLCKKIGYSGYKEFSKDLIFEQAIRSKKIKEQNPELNKSDSISEIIDKVTQKNVMFLQETETLLSESIVKQCIEEIYKCDKLVFFGMGASLIVAKDAQLKFTRINKLSYLSEDWHTQLLHARNMNNKDLAIVISYSGMTQEMITCVEAAKENGATIITVTKSHDSPINRLADYALYVASNEYSFRSGAMSSRIAQLNVIDILFSGYVNLIYDESLEILEKTQIKKEQ